MNIFLFVCLFVCFVLQTIPCLNAIHILFLNRDFISKIRKRHSSRGPALWPNCNCDKRRRRRRPDCRKWTPPPGAPRRSWHRRSNGRNSDGGDGNNCRCNYRNCWTWRARGGPRASLASNGLLGGGSRWTMSPWSTTSKRDCWWWLPRRRSWQKHR